MKLTQKMINCFANNGYSYNSEKQIYFKNIKSKPLVDKDNYTYLLGNIIFHCMGNNLVNCAFWEQKNKTIVTTQLQEIWRQMDYMETELDHIYLGRE